jgi:tetratricopeptide (TPR) repeat protein
MASGRKLASFKEWHLAAHAFKRATEIQPNYAEAWAFLGEAQQHLDESSTTNAFACLETALALDPNSLSANIFMALYRKRAGEHESSYEYLSTAARIDPDNPAILVDLGEATAILGDLDGGYNYYLKAIEQTFNDPNYLQALVKFCLRFNYRLEEIALPTARMAIRLDSENSGSLDVMGQLLFRFGDLLNAERFYIRAIQKDPGYAPAYLHLGLIYNLQDKPEQAKEAFTRAIRLAPETATATLAERFSEIPELP